MQAAWATQQERLPRDHGHLALLDSSIGYLRQFTPGVLGAIAFAGGPGSEDVLAAVTMLAQLYASGAGKVPADAPTGFVPARRAGYLASAQKADDVTGYRHYWELCVLLALRDGLRCGDVFVAGSRRYADPTSFLLTPNAWAPLRGEYCELIGKPSNAGDALARIDDELHRVLADLDGLLVQDGTVGDVRLNDDGELIIPPLTAEDIPGEAAELRDQLAGMLPRVPLTSLLAEVDARCGSIAHLVHAGGEVSQPGELRRNLIYVLIAEATNMELTAMADSCGVPNDVLAWTAQWYFREDTLRAANTAMVNYHHRLALASAFGPGTLSSSDGQRFPTKGKSITARAMSRYFARGQGISTYTHVSDQHSTFDTKVIVARYPHAGPLLTRRANTELIAAQWDDMLRVAASVKYGHTSAALVVGKLCSSKRQRNALSAAIKEYGGLVRTIHTARYLSDEAARRRVARQLNKGENLHSLRRELAHAGEGAIRHRDNEAQTEQMWCLTLVTNAIVTWSAEYYGRATAALAATGHPVDDSLLAHVWPSTTRTSTPTAATPSTSTVYSPSSIQTAADRCAP